MRVVSRWRNELESMGLPRPVGMAYVPAYWRVL
jgi:hypothetical protein